MLKIREPYDKQQCHQRKGGYNVQERDLLEINDQADHKTYKQKPK